MKKKTIKRVFLSAICCVLCVVTIAFSSHIVYATALSEAENSSSESDNAKNTSDAEESYKNQLAGLQEQQADISKRQEELNNKISSAKSEKKKLQAQANSLDEQIGIARDQMELCQQKIDITKEYIAAKQNEINEKQADIDDSMQLFRDRMRAIYMTGGYSDKANSLIMLLSSESVSEFLTRTVYLQRINEHDRKLMDELETELVALNEEKAELDEVKAQLETEKEELSATRDSLQASLIEARSSIQDINAMQSEWEEDYEELSAYSKQIQAEIADIYKNLTTTTEDYVGGEMMWPVPGYSKISCYYGWRFNNTDFHTGMDITGSGIHGAKVVAANTGTVIFTKQCPYNGYSYGYGTYIIVDHGGGITTLYAHLSAITVNVGDIVVMGQQIGNVGNTGWSTGAHLHFEVRQNGSSVNPLPYVTG